MSKLVRLGELANTYRVALQNPHIQQAYEGFMKYVMNLKSYAQNEYFDRYSFGNVSPGYMDYTYFPFFNEFLRTKKLRFGIVLNHKALRFELWLMGQNAEIQKKYWEILKTTPWNKGVEMMPKYSVLEAILVESPDFNDLNTLTKEIISKAITTAEEVSRYLR